MKTESLTIKAMLREISEDKVLLPQMQRSFVWKEDKIEDFLDSLLRGYPIGIFLFWVTNKKVYSKSFEKDYLRKRIDSSISDLKEYRKGHKYIILDGQQRIQSLYIGLQGSFNGKDLYFNLASSAESAEQHKNRNRIFDFKFFKQLPSKQETTYIRVKDIYSVLSNRTDVGPTNVEEILKELAKKCPNIENIDLGVDKKIVHENLEKIFRGLFNYDLTYFKVDDNQNQEEILNIFTRINNGGTKLSISDLMFSQVKTYWRDVEVKFNSLIRKINQGGSSFNLDHTFIIKALLTIIKDNCRFDLENINKEFSEAIKSDWESIVDSFSKAYDFLNSVHIYNNSTLVSNVAVIPIIYGYYKKKITKDDSLELKKFIYISQLKNVWSSQPENKVNIAIKQMEKKGFDSSIILKKLIGENIKIEEQDITSISARKNYKLILNLMYFDGKTLLLKRSKIDQLDADHIFPKAHCKKYFDDAIEYNTILNYCYLSSEQNRVEKQTCPPDTYFEDSSSIRKETYKKHLISKDSLFRYPVSSKSKIFCEKYLQFKEDRKKLILDKIKAELKK